MAARCIITAPLRLRLVALALAIVPGLAGASHRTANFVVEVPNGPADVARQVAERAEACRASIARAWLAMNSPPGRRPARSASS